MKIITMLHFGFGKLNVVSMSLYVCTSISKTATLRLSQEKKFTNIKESIPKQTVEYITK